MASERIVKLQARVFLFAKGVAKRMTLGARGALIDGRKVLMLKHTYVPGWQFPGGGVDPGETMEEAFRREVLEETGYAVGTSADLFGVYHNMQATNRDHVALYVTREFSVARPFKPNREIAEIAWFSCDALPDDVSKCTRARVAEIFANHPISPHW